MSQQLISAILALSFSTFCLAGEIPGGAESRRNTSAASVDQETATSRKQSGAQVPQAPKPKP